MPANDTHRLTVGSLIGLPIGATRVPDAAEPAVPDVEGPNWRVEVGEVSVGGQSGTQFRPDGVEVLTYTNPFGQLMERVWFDGKVVFAVDLGQVKIDPNIVRVAQEYQVVFEVKLDAHGQLIGEPELVPGQLNIYDSVPGMPVYSPIWQFNYVVVPRDYTPNTLRSQADCLSSGYPILRSQVFEN